MVYGTYNCNIVTGAYKPTNITGGPHIVWFFQVIGFILVFFFQWMGFHIHQQTYISIEIFWDMGKIPNYVPLLDYFILFKSGSTVQATNKSLGATFLLPNPQLNIH